MDTKKISLGVTGHRPDKLGGWRLYRTPQGLSRLSDLAVALITKLEYQGFYLKELISGMAPGWDTACAMVAVELQIPLIAAIPFEGQHDRWQNPEQEIYFELLAQASEVNYISEPGYDQEKMFARNRWIVDRSDRLIALWNAAESGLFSGTGQCVRYAQSHSVPVNNVWNSWIQYKDKI